MHPLVLSAVVGMELAFRLHFGYIWSKKRRRPIETVRAAAQRRAKPIETVPTLQISVFSKPGHNCSCLADLIYS